MTQEHKPASNSIQGFLDSLRAEGVRDDEPFARIGRALAAVALDQRDIITEFREELKQSLPIDKIEAKRAMLTVMIDAKGEFLRYIASEYQTVIVLSLVVVAALFFVLGWFVGTNLQMSR